MGFTGDERQRVERWRANNPMVDMQTPLVDAMLDKKDCMAICGELGLDLPYMYKLGYSNANCIGCVKASSIGYWAAIREDFPDVFKWYAEFERQIGAKDEDGTPKGATICKKYVDSERIRVFLDEIPADFPAKRNVSISCGYSCGMQDMEEIVDELTGSPSFFALDYEERLKDFFNANKGDAK